MIVVFGVVLMGRGRRILLLAGSLTWVTRKGDEIAEKERYHDMSWQGSIKILYRVMVSLDVS